MADSFEIAYLYARVCGAYSNMYLGGKGAALAREATLPAVWKLFFDGEIPNKNESWILSSLERKVIERQADKFMELAGPFEESDAFIAALTAKNEVAAVKRIVYALSAGQGKPESALYSDAITARAIAAWPRLDDMFSGTPYSWIDDAALIDLGVTENRLDKQYYVNLWNSVSSLPRNKRGNIPAIVLMDIRYQNIVWALRIRKYFGYTRERAEDLLVRLEGEDATSAALETFGLDIDNPASFAKWSQKALLDGQNSQSLDVPLLESHIRKELFAAVRRSLHMYPFGYTPLYCYFKMLEAETSFMLGILEGIRLKAPVEEKIELAWALTGETI